MANGNFPDNRHGNRFPSGIPPHKQHENPVLQKRRELEKIMREVQADQRKYAMADSQKNHASTSHIKRFEQALQHLNNMLSGKARLSLADAYYITEQAFGNSYLTQEEYNATIKQSVGFIRNWMKQNGLDIRDNYMVHYAIQKFMSEPLTIYHNVTQPDKTVKLEPVTHQPFRYDYNDYAGEKDYRNLFLTKCLATGFGQCSSMPAVYMVLAEGMGVNAYLSLAPYHSFIKYPDNNGVIFNYEPTSHWEISDKWYKDNMFISAKAVENRLYLDTLGKRKIVADCIFNLAIEYIIIDRTGQEDFILHCLTSGMAHFPENNNLQALFIKSIHLKTALRETMRKSDLYSFDNMERFPEVKKLYNEYMANEAHIAQLGYQDIPPGMYENMLRQQEFKGKVQSLHNVNTKQKKSLFTNIE